LKTTTEKTGDRTKYSIEQDSFIFVWIEGTLTVNIYVKGESTPFIAHSMNKPKKSNFTAFVKSWLKDQARQND
jgi:hypothetical protein